VATTRVEPAVCLGSSQRSWVTDLISHVSDHGGLRVVGTVLTQDDSLALDYDVLVVDDVSSVLTPRLVERVHIAGRLVVAVYDAERGVAAHERVLAAGVDAGVSSDAPVADLVRAIVDAVRQRSIDDEFAVLVDDLGDDGVDRAHPADVPALDLRTGGVITVAGSDGATEVAIGIAHELVARGVSTVLVDLDTLEPAVAQRVGMRLTPNILTATEHLRLRSSLDDAFATHRAGFALVAGIPNPREWENLSESEAADLVGELAGGFDAVVVKISRHLEDLAGLAGTAGRFDVGRRITAMADHFVAVANASPLGSTRLMALLGEQGRLGTVRPHVVVNETPASLFVQGEIGQELRRTVTPASLTFLPVDPRVRKASWQAELVRPGPFTRRLARMVDHLAPRPPGRMRRRPPDEEEIDGNVMSPDPAWEEQV
jgi:MinD-like ATPase involved in chromosome partitioning or flagellar assembly